MILLRLCWDPEIRDKKTSLLVCDETGDLSEKEREIHPMFFRDRRLNEIRGATQARNETTSGREKERLGGKRRKLD